MESTYFRRGFGLKAEIEGQLTADYHSTVVEALRARDYRLAVGPLSFRLAREFGFCYGVDRAVEYAYETRRKFPDRRLYLVGEIIHNPHVNQKLRDMGVRFLVREELGRFDFSGIGAQDVVILPAFGVTMEDFERLRALGCVLVDTTCGSVLNVWKRVDSYARDGYTAVIHGKHYHEETKATASQVMKYPGGPVSGGVQHGGSARSSVTSSSTGAMWRRWKRGSPRRSLPDSTSRGTSSASGSRTRPPCCPASPSRSRMRSAGAWSGAMAPTRWPTTSARSTPSARPPRSGRTRCWR